MSLVLEMLGLRADVDMLKVAFGNSLKVGPVEEVDAVKGYRLKLSEDGYLSPWYPHPESGKTSVPLKKGDIVGVINPSGDPRQGMMFRAGYSGPRPSPNDDMDANVFDDAGVRLTIKDGVLSIKASGGVKIEVGGVTHEITADGITTAGGTIVHDDLDVGSTHKHRDVTPGGALTGLPIEASS